MCNGETLLPSYLGYQTIRGLRVRDSIFFALNMLLKNKRLKRPNGKIYLYDMMRDALVEFIDAHPEYHDPSFDCEALKKDFYASHAYSDKTQKESESK